ncbi:phage minor tail protein L [Pantoea stewartii]|uniref:phage minor tail protein L n=1 Tax=Pantoea stewartii TaxID=66269 RepID=UPI00197E89BD|nr:phage minor tail protein L [Pantoea stewartii]
MQNILPDTLNELTRTEQAGMIDLWELDLGHFGGKRYLFCNEKNARGKAMVWQKRRYRPYPVRIENCEMRGRGAATRPALVVSNLYGVVTGLAEAHQSLVGGIVVRHRVSPRFLDAENFSGGNLYADPEQESRSQYVVEQLAELNDVIARFILAVPTETAGLLCPARIMLSDLCPWKYRSADCGYAGPPVADEQGKPVTDLASDHCGNCPSGCRLRKHISRFGGFLSINPFSQ